MIEPHVLTVASPPHKRQLTWRLCKFASLFFLLKGVAWLIVPALIAWFGRG